MTHPIMVLSDLHLSQSSQIKTQILCELIREYCQQVSHIYFLGDVFDCWLGAQKLPLWLQPLISAIDYANSQDCQVSMMTGNHDFLLSKQCILELKAHQLPDPSILYCGELKLLVTHGDLLCTNDHGYLRLRSIIQHPWFKYLFCRCPTTLKQAIAKTLKSASDNSNKQRPEKANPVLATIYQWCQKYQSNFIIHGHTHIAKQQRLKRNNLPEIKYLITAAWQTDQGFFDLIYPTGTVDRFAVTLTTQQKILITKL